MSANDDDRIADVIAEEGAREVNGWRLTDPDPDLSRDTVLRQWDDESGELHVVFTRDSPPPSGDREEPSYGGRLIPDDDVAGVPKTTITTFGENLENSLDTTINWLRTHTPGLPRGRFTMRLSGGVLLPVVDILRRFTADALIEAREGEVAIKGRSPFTVVEIVLPVEDMDAYDLEREGQVAVNSDEFWGLVQDFNFGDTVSVAVGDRDGRPTIEAGGVRKSIEDAVTYRRQTFPAVEPADARFTTTGQEFGQVTRGAEVVAEDRSSDEVAFGVNDGAAIVVVEDEDTGERFAGRMTTSELEGEGVVAMRLGRLRDVRIAVPRPASTKLSFTIREAVPLLVEYDVDGASVDARVAIEDPETVAGFDLTPPVEEIEAVVEDEPEPEAPAEPTDEEPEMPERDLTRSEIETIVENAVLGVDVTVQMIADDLREIKMRPRDDAPVTFETDVSTITQSTVGGVRETIRAAVETWRENVNLRSIADPDRIEVNRRREALNDQFGLGLPELEAPPEGEPEEEEPAAEPTPEAPPKEPAEREAVTADGFTEDELAEIITQSTSGAVPEVTIKQVPQSSVPVIDIEWTIPEQEADIFLEEPRSVTNLPGDQPIAAVNRALEAWEDAVDLRSLPDGERELVTNQRDDLEAEFGIDLVEIGAAAPEQPGRREPAEKTEPGSVWQRVKVVALNQDIPRTDREFRIGELLEDMLVEEYPSEFEDLTVGLDFQQGAGAGQDVEDVLLLELGGELSNAGRQRFVEFPSLNIIDAKGSIRDPEEVWTDFLDLVTMFDPEDSQFSDVTSKLQTVSTVSAFRIEDELVDFDDIFIPPSIVKQLVRRNRDLYTLKILGYMEDTSKAWHAAQRVQECANGVQAICNLIEEEIAGRTPRGWTEWYLKKAYTIFLEEGTFDPAVFTREWHGVFQPGEAEQKARDRRGPVDLDTLGRPGQQPQEEPDRQPPRDDDSGGDGGIDDDGGGNGTVSMQDLRDEMDDRV